MHAIIDRKDLDFLLFDVLKIEEFSSYERYSDHDREVYTATIQTAYDIAADKFLTHYVKADQNEPHLIDGKVKLIPEIGEAHEEYIGAGFLSAGRDYDDDGTQLPFVIQTACNALFTGANVSSFGYLGLSQGNASLIDAYGDDEQKRLYMEPIYDGLYSGTMCLSEPQAGSSLADIKTKAIPTEEGHYKIDGAKMWISAGDHELTENIIHLVLARIDGAPEGSKGISLFIVPKYRVQENGEIGDFNDVTLAGLNHKMGHRGITNCFLKFGEQGDCHGYLVGEANSGLRYMFHMMNHARIAVGCSAIMLGYAGYLYSLEYAKERLQGRALSKGKDPSSPPVPIIKHADVKRMLLQQRSYVQGALALLLWAAKLEDQAKYSPMPGEQKKSAKLLALVTPVVKSWSSEYCLKANELALQILGGYGYTREYICEQLYRDNRLNPIHEGTTGIQGLTLLGNQVPADGGKAFFELLEEIQSTIHTAEQHENLKLYAQLLAEYSGLLKEVSIKLIGAMSNGDLEKALCNSSLYLDSFGLVTVGWMWLKQAVTLHEQKSAPYDEDFFNGKLHTCAYFFNYEMVRIPTQCEILSKMDHTIIDMQENWF
ncbi:MAG: acyl-CoA dehydrogenase [Emcibacter sp.]|nr:acyl-CoA dehydrogenase [Emcibacter sp.]